MEKVDNSKKIILDLCGGTGAWSKPYKDAGYDVRLITLPYYNVTDVVFTRDYMVFNKHSYDVYDMGIEYSHVCGILAAPPCTEFSLAKADNPRDFAAGMEVVNACLNIIWNCRRSAKLKFWALENPRAFLRQFLGKPPFTFEHWQFGEMQSKPTDLWGYYNNPKSTVSEKPEGMMYRFANGSLNGKDWMHPKCPPEYRHLKLNRAALRAITPPGFAKAFFKANR